METMPDNKAKSIKNATKKGPHNDSKYKSVAEFKVLSTSP